ncbi:MAG: molybdopterin molybdotransferase MoeA [Thermanaeromonas sp.]|uniref:molybdopterin molybdotransferase MoeA n=1 Tax=Thermanaeromonas sp. TaxID=2003697 RepID=UPI00243B447F|nr:molybdopterin molybdotransferase MoeA [Thermanaeromonas sp.]MCG0277772.1 molybdopterin molybdotransferase MoeA [Thermanaeromonas sp.]
MKELLEWEEALCLLEEIVTPLTPVKVPLADSAGLVLAEEITSPVPFPPFTRSRVDGYALGPVAGESYRLVGEVPAGGKYPYPLGPGEAVRIFTGAPVPVGAVGVLPQEWAREEEGRLYPVSCADASVLASLVQREGEEIGRGEEVLRPGIVLTPAEIGLLAALGFKEVAVYPRPQVAVMAVGSELRDADEYGENTIPGSNLFALEAGLKLEGVKTFCLPPLPDDLERVTSSLREMINSVDLIITSGGTGEGKYDLTARAFLKAGAELLFTRLNFRPGGRVIMARRGRCFLVGLPGTPSAALVSFYLLVRPLLRALAGKNLKPCLWKGILVEEFTKERRQRYFHYARACNKEGVWELIPVNLKQAPLKAGVGANALLDLPAGKCSIDKGVELNFVPLNYI